jgi:hypothetical protein
MTLKHWRYLELILWKKFIVADGGSNAQKRWHDMLRAHRWGGLVR